MEPEIFEKMFLLEADHFWFVGQRCWLSNVMARYNINHSVNILDIGCGTGAVLEMLGDHSIPIGMDIEPLALRYCKRRGLDNLIRADAADIPFRNISFHKATMLGVLYHQRVKSPAGVLMEINRVLKPNGRLFFSEPAYNWIRGSHDRAEHTERRFTRKQLSRLLSEAGFEPVWISYFNFLSLFPAIIKRCIIPKVIKQPDRDDLNIPPKPLGGLMKLLIRIEAHIAPRVCLPAGLAVIGEAVKRSTPRHT